MPGEVRSSQLRSEAATRKEEGRKEKVPLIKSRDPHLAGGEKGPNSQNVTISTISIINHSYSNLS